MEKRAQNITFPKSSFDTVNYARWIETASQTSANGNLDDDVIVND